MTHSLRVAQVALRLAEHLLADASSRAGIRAAGGLDPNIAQAAGLAHDMGHPPFGHIGEEVLDSIAQENGLDGFEGNAQTFRIVATILRHQPRQEGSIEVQGMDLTDATLAACVKYPWQRQESGKRHRKFGYYKEDSETFIQRVTPLVGSRAEVGTLEAQVMDWADDITYATHDIEDFYASGQIPLERLAHRSEGDPDVPEQVEYIPLNKRDFEQFWAYSTTKLSKYSRIPSDAALRKFQCYAALFPRTPFDGTFSRRALVSSRVSKIITDAINACSVEECGTLTKDRDPGVESAIEVMKQLTWYYVISRPKLRSLQIGQQTKLRRLANELIRWSCEALRRSDIPDDHIPTKDQLSSADERWANRTQLPPVLMELISQTPVTRDTWANPGKDRLHIARAVIDYIALLTEREVDEHFRRMVEGRSG